MKRLPPAADPLLQLPVSRRTALAGMAAGLATLTSTSTFGAAAAGAPRPGGTPPAGTAVHWEDGPMRWAQLIFSEEDLPAFDPQLWCDYFRRIHVDGVCLSAGGFTAFYPTTIPLHHRAADIEKYDAFGAMVKGCRALGLKIIARVEPGGLRKQAFEAHPEWALRTPDGAAQPYFSSPDDYMNCALGGYAFDFVTSVIREVMEKYEVDAIFGNRWMPQARCYCDSCRTLFRAATGREIPLVAGTDGAAQRAYAAWSQARLLELAALWNEAIRSARPTGFFSGNGIGLPVLELKAFSDITPMICADRQGRHGSMQPWENGKFAKILRSTMGEKPIACIFSGMVLEGYGWKESVQSEAEIRTWVAAGVAQGFRPWFFKGNVKLLDRRWMPVIERIFDWHWRNERHLRNTANLARVALLTTDAHVNPFFYFDAEATRQLEYHNGYYQALAEARVPTQLLYDRSMSEAELDRYRVLVLPNITRLSDAQCRMLREYVLRGGRIVATHETSLYDENGERRSDFGLADLFGCSFDGQVDEKVRSAYLTLHHPHPLLRGLEQAPRVVGPSRRVHVRANGTGTVPLTLVPPDPGKPLEFGYSSMPDSGTPMAICREVGKGRVVYFPMDLDRLFAEMFLADHQALLRNAVEWAADEAPLLRVTGPGFIDVACWRQQESLAVHLVNYNNAATMKGPYRETVATGPYTVDFELPAGARPRRIRLLEGGHAVSGRRDGNRLQVVVPQVAVHEVVAIDLA